MLSFGPYKFVPTSLKYNKKNRWSVIECIDVMPSLQNIGQGVENIELGSVDKKYEKREKDGSLA
ncbi:hypothetical protein [Wolbachia endosymbiont (group A) of Trypoxylon clavicerum]|uniref:hypothetical protein n=1 Tax=Wolbachia endosymbiont (group A) of Trypoxylon clavicerum TaxID=2954064 RepID=UPI00222EC2DE|nr:hypothetical protein [Wolbachia endosymbiont (group A) of Trypoxylon clavicerum]